MSEGDSLGGDFGLSRAAVKEIAQITDESLSQPPTTEKKMGREYYLQGGPSFCWFLFLAGASHWTHREPELIPFGNLVGPLFITKGTTAFDARTNSVQFFFALRFIDSLDQVGQSRNRPWREYFWKWHPKKTKPVLAQQTR